MARGTNEQHLISEVLALIDRLRESWERTSDADLLNFPFVKRRMAEMADCLAMSQDMIAKLTDLLYGSVRNPVPVALRHARRARSSKLQAVKLEIGGIVRTVVVRPAGEDDPIEEARMWRQLSERYGGTV
jgi:hypothetical protein